jgi:hypothetical protein
MEHATALRRIENMKFNVRPKSNQLTAIGNLTNGFDTKNSRGVEAATAASTHAGLKKKSGSSHRLSQLHNGKLQKASIPSADFCGQLNFEFAGNKNSMIVFMHRLRRVYHTPPIKD